MELARKAVADVVLRQQALSHTPVVLRLVLAKPDDLRRRETRQNTVAGLRDDEVLPSRLVDPVALGPGALVAPEQGGPNHLSVRVEEDAPVHLPRESDALNLRAPEVRFAERQKQRFG